MIDVHAIAFSLSKTWSYKAKKEAIDAAGSFQSLLENSKEKFESIDLKPAEIQVGKLQKLNAWVWIYGEPSYPSILAKIPNPPLIVYGLGQSTLDAAHTLGVIGTRTPTAYGRRIGATISTDLALEGITLVSGLARGIDSIAHKACVDLQTPTLAAVAHGIDMVYPPENKKLATQIIDCGGTILSEFPIGITPLRAYFSQRNRIISGLSNGILVVEASEKSGTRHTVNHALEQNREVFAIPGPIDSEFSSYTNELIFAGGNMVRSVQDILSYFPNRKTRAKSEQKNFFKPSRVQFEMLQFLDKDQPKSMEELMQTSRLPVSVILQNLTELELHGMIIKQPNQTYILI